MSRCYACCQENCGYGSCGCSCHGDRTPPPPACGATCNCTPCVGKALRAVAESARKVRHKTKALREALADLDRRTK